MAHSAIAFAKQQKRQRMMMCTTSIGPGALNMVTAAGLAHANRLPVLFVVGDTFANRTPDPVLQQIECFGDPTISVNDCFKPVSRYFDRFVRPEQLITSLPMAIQTLLDPANCGPVTLAFPQDVQELIAYFGDAPDGAAVRAIPGTGTKVPVWILGSSLYGAELAAHFGLPYAFASHFAPAMLEDAISTYRGTFRPSAALDKPYVIMAAGVCAADTDAQALYLRTSQQLAFARLIMGKPGKLPRPVDDLSAHIPAQVLAQVNGALGCSATGSAKTIAAQFQSLLDSFQPDELMVTGMIHDHAARLKSFEIAAQVLRRLQLRT